jgi:hypothetical protein
MVGDSAPGPAHSIVDRNANGGGLKKLSPTLKLVMRAARPGLIAASDITNPQVNFQKHVDRNTFKIFMCLRQYQLHG